MKIQVYKIYSYKAGGYIKYPIVDINLAINELSGNAYKLFTYYLGLPPNNYEIDEKEIAKLIKVTDNTLRVLKTELRKKGYLIIEKYRGRHTYFVGKDAVEEYVMGVRIV